MKYSILNFLSKPKRIRYSVRDSQEFSRFCRDSHQSGLYPYPSDDIRNAYLQTRQTTTLMTGDTIEITWTYAEHLDSWISWMTLKGHELTIK